MGVKVLAKLPKYIKMQFQGPPLGCTLAIKKWGIPIILFKAYKDMEVTPKILKWILFPILCFRIMGRWTYGAAE